MEIVEGGIILELLVEIETFGLVEAGEVVVVNIVGSSEMEYTIGFGELVEVGVKLADV